MPTLDDVRGIARGTSALVMGSGASLRALPNDDERVKGHVVVAVNDALVKAPDADFYVTADAHMLYYHHWELLRNSDICAVLPSYAFKRGKMASYGLGEDRVVLFDRRSPAKVIELKANARSYETQSSAMAGVLTAVILGCSPVYIMGCEGECEDGRKYFWEFPGQPGPGGTKAGYATIWQQVQASRGRRIVAEEYDATFDTRRGGRDDDTIRRWAEVSRTSARADVVNVTGKLPGSKFRRASVDEMLAAGAVCSSRVPGESLWRTLLRRARGA